LPVNKSRLDKRLMELNLVEDVKLAQSLIMSGKVLVNGVIVLKAGTMVKTGDEIRLRTKILEYVSKGGYKLAAALERFSVSVAGKTVLDAGASTGGFTDCLLQKGAAKVYAVDAGFGQLRGSLMTDKRVVYMEKTNIGDLSIGLFDPALDLGTADLSYLSLRKAIPILSRLFSNPVRLICLVKPLFEGLRESDFDNIKSIGEILLPFFTDLEEQAGVNDVIVSPILGNSGTIEFLIYINAGQKSRVTCPERGCESVGFTHLSGGRIPFPEGNP
jgi:23S rRNA (cytidine1920-2'-O)/16S rRNA (cytidine1409-2'-O)-methyltransferase